MNRKFKIAIVRNMTKTEQMIGVFGCSLFFILSPLLFSLQVIWPLVTRVWGALVWTYNSPLEFWESYKLKIGVTEIVKNEEPEVEQIKRKIGLN